MDWSAPNYVVELDRQEQRMVLHEPAECQYSGKGTGIPLVIAGAMPFVRLSVSVTPGKAANGLISGGLPWTAHTRDGSS